MGFAGLNPSYVRGDGEEGRCYFFALNMPVSTRNLDAQGASKLLVQRHPPPSFRWVFYARSLGMSDAEVPRREGGEYNTRKGN